MVLQLLNQITLSLLKLIPLEDMEDTMKFLAKELQRQCMGLSSLHILHTLFKFLHATYSFAIEPLMSMKGLKWHGIRYRLKHRRVNIRAVKHWCRQILKGLLYLHSHDPPVIHRDLKCDNIFINGNQGEVKIGDLGLAAILRKAHAARCVGTPEFMAPEVYEEEYNELVDIYSFGMCILEMVTSEYPYSECTHPAQIYKKVTSGKKPEALYKVEDPEVRLFVEKCLATVSRRLTARELLKDPFLQIDDYGYNLSPIGYRGDFDELGPLLREPHYGIYHSNCSLINDYGNYLGYIPENDFETSELDLFTCQGDEHLADVDITIKGKRREDDGVFLRLRIVDKEGRIRNIYFPFDIEIDTALSVAAEMVTELDITDQDVTKIADMIDGEISTLVPEWKRGLGIEGSPHNTSASFCHDCVSNGSLLDYVSSNNPGAKNLQVLQCSKQGGAAVHSRFEEITYQVEESEQCVTEGAPKTSSQSGGGIHFADIWAQLDGPELSSQRSREIHWDEGSKTLDQTPFGSVERIINVDDQCISNATNSLSTTTSADYALLDDYENDIRQELRWLKAKYQMQLRELRDQQLGAKWKSSSMSPKSPSLDYPPQKRASNETLLESLSSGKHFTSDFPIAADKKCSSVANQSENSEGINESFSPEKMFTTKNFYSGVLLPHSLHRATSLPVDAVDV
ncbi:probable serine/threonine-protein kinase WNK9 isoform X4 [Quercus suber]|uniref:probable serine/threonine-protein kinase WNK9 isoform X4 n=1 Tax=Quercus suber TaxID=58331 RepID=UPI0032DFDFED